MKFALINPRWSFDGSIYFGCKDHHLPLELGYSKQILEQSGHETLLIDGHQDDLTEAEIVAQIDAFDADIVVLTTANSYLFWRCAQPELRVPLLLTEQLQFSSRFLVAVGPHASTTPRATIHKLNVDAVVLGECEEILPLFGQGKDSLGSIPSIAYRDHQEIRIQGRPRASNMTALPALQWEDSFVKKHKHHHHRFDARTNRPGAEMEASRGCPYHCTFCAKENFRDNYRKRPLQKILDEIDGLIRQDVEYIYFIDEIFLPDEKLLRSLLPRNLRFGIQTRIDLWSTELLELLGKAGCVSLEAGVESITPEGREALDKKCRLTTQQLAEKLICAKQNIPFVQANLLESQADAPEDVEQWRHYLIGRGVWANEPVPLFPYPGSPEYTRLWGTPDDYAWERAQNYYMKTFEQFSDIQEQKPLSLHELEAAPR